jgi:endoglucanase
MSIFKKVHAILFVTAMLLVSVISGCLGGTTSPEPVPAPNPVTPDSNVNPNPNPVTPVASHFILPSNKNDEIVTNMYNAFMTYYYEEGTCATTGLPCGRIKWDDGFSDKDRGEHSLYAVSEGIAYGMVAALYAHDQHRFDMLTNFYLSNLNDFGLMKWCVKMWSGQTVATGDDGSAADADLDAAVALLMASKKWPDRADYLQHAYTVLAAIKEELVMRASENFLIAPGDSWNDVYNPSYMSLAAMQLFSEMDPNSTWYIHAFVGDPNPAAVDWGTVLNYNQIYLMNSQDGPTKGNSGLWPDWANKDGIAESPPYHAKATFHLFYLDAVRTPWRVFWHYQWYGNENSKAMLSTLANWAYGYHGGDPLQIGDRYEFMDRTTKQPKPVAKTGPGSKGQHMGFVGALGMAGMVDPNFQGWVDGAYTILANTPMEPANYYESILHILFIQQMSGHMVKY